LLVRVNRVVPEAPARFCEKVYDSIP
jgi:hypothetical protein